MLGSSAILTIGIPVFNAMPFLPEAMESLFRQTIDGFEILLIVDGGTDDSLAYLQSLRHPQLRILEQPNAGVTATLNRILRETRTPWLVRQDADDVSYPSRMETLLAAIHDHPQAGLIYSLADYHPREKCAGQFRCSRGTPEQLRAIVDSGYLLSICHSAVALSVKKALAAGGYRMDLHAEDADLWWRMARRYPIHFIPEALVGFRMNANSISSRHLEKQQLAAIYVQYLLLSDLWGHAPRPLPDVAQTLVGFLHPAGIAAKDGLRHSNMHLADGAWLRAAASLARAFCHSPHYVLTRMRDELGRGAIVNGVAPRLFWERKEALW